MVFLRAMPFIIALSAKGRKPLKRKEEVAKTLNDAWQKAGSGYIPLNQAKGFPFAQVFYGSLALGQTVFKIAEFWVKYANFSQTDSRDEG